MAYTETVTATVASSGTVSSAIDYRMFTSGRFYLTTEFDGDTITFQDAEKPNGTFAVSKTAATTIAITFTANTGAAWYDIPVALRGAGAIKIVTSVGAAAAATIIVCLKSD